MLDSQRDGSVQGVCELQKTLRIIAGIRSGEIAFTLGKRFPKSCAFVKTRAPLAVDRVLRDFDGGLPLSPRSGYAYRAFNGPRLARGA